MAERFFKGPAVDRHQSIFALTHENLSKAERRRIMQGFTIEEISAVDHPAQQGAKAMIVKRDDSKEITERDVAFSKWLEEDAERRRAEALEAFLDAQQEQVDALKAQMSDEEKKLLRDAAIAEQRKPGKEMTMFEQKVAEIQKREGCSRLLAMKKAREEYPGAFEHYQEEGVINVAKASAGAPAGFNLARHASDTLSAKAQEIAKRDGVKLTEAMAKARQQNPSLY